MKKLLVLLAIGQFLTISCASSKKKLFLGTLSQSNAQQVDKLDKVKQDENGFDLEKIVQQAKDLLKMKEDIQKILDSCFDLISQAERQKRDELHKMPNPESKQQIEDRIQSFLMNKLFSMQGVLRKLHKELVNDILNSEHQPCNGINFAA